MVDVAGSLSGCRAGLSVVQDLRKSESNNNNDDDDIGESIGIQCGCQKCTFSLSGKSTNDGTDTTSHVSGIRFTILAKWNSGREFASASSHKKSKAKSSDLGKVFDKFDTSEEGNGGFALFD